MKGFPAISNNALGTRSVNGRRRVANPPARIAIGSVIQTRPLCPRNRSENEPPLNPRKTSRDGGAHGPPHKTLKSRPRLRRPVCLQQPRWRVQAHTIGQFADCSYHRNVFSYVPSARASVHRTTTASLLRAPVYCATQVH